MFAFLFPRSIFVPIFVLFQLAFALSFSFSPFCCFSFCTFFLSFSFSGFILSFSVCFFHRLLRSSFRVAALLGGRFCNFVSVLHAPCSAREPASLWRIPLVCFLVSSWSSFFLYFFSRIFCLHIRFRYGRRLFHPVLFLYVLFTMSPRFLLLLFVFFALNRSLSTRRQPTHPVSVPVVPL